MRLKTNRENYRRSKARVIMIRVGTVGRINGLSMAIGEVDIAPFVVTYSDNVARWRPTAIIQKDGTARWGVRRGSGLFGEHYLLRWPSNIGKFLSSVGAGNRRGIG